jgi:hypothetical protein
MVFQERNGGVVRNRLRQTSPMSDRCRGNSDGEKAYRQKLRVCLLSFDNKDTIAAPAGCPASAETTSCMTIQEYREDPQPDNIFYKLFVASLDFGQTRPIAVHHC